MERQTKSNCKPSAIPRLTRHPETNISTISTASRENLNPTKLGYSTLKSPRLRQSTSRDQVLISSGISTPAKPRLPILDLHAPKITNGTDKNLHPISRYDHSSSRQHHQPKNTKHEENGIGTFRSVDSDCEKIESPQISRPSLSERAVETLQNIPSSPALRSRESTFFNNDLKSSPNSRPNSRSACASNDGSNSFQGGFRSFTDNSRNPQLVQNTTPLKRPSKIASSNNQSVLRSVGPNILTPKSSTVKSNFILAKPLKYESKTLSPKSIEHRSSMQSLLRKPSASALQKPKENNPIVVPKKRAPKITTCPPDEISNSLITKDKVASRLSVSGSGTEGKNLRKSSSALRDQIAKAKAMKRAASLQVSHQATGDVPVIPPDSLDFKLSDDPFNQNTAQNNAKDLLKKRVQSALKKGSLNISGMGLKELPHEVLNMFSPNNMEDICWGEVVDLLKLIAIDNEIEELPTDAFPDVDPSSIAEQDEIKTCQFYSLETIELRGNKLRKLPYGLRRLENLTRLNLSGNQLENECLHIISKISSLQELALDHNRLTGQLGNDLCKLGNLVTLNLKHNELSGLSDDFSELSQLQTLNVSENQLISLPFNAFGTLSLTELIASKNKLTDVLIPESIDVLPYLQILDVTCNSLTSISLSDIRLPALQKIFCASNRLKELPSLVTWSCLITIDAEDNCIEKLPYGLVTLPSIRSVNFHGNQLRSLDEKLGELESLETFHIGGNPLREKKFLSMSTSELKRTLLLRLEPEEEEKEINVEQTTLSENDSMGSPTSIATPSSPAWVVQLSNVLDRSNTQSHSLNPVAAAEISAQYQIKVLLLHHNNFQVIPESIAFFATTLITLNMSHNELSSDTYINDNLELPELRELNLSSNTFNSLQPIIQNLQAPKLERLDISFNRLSSLPALRNHFPNLTTLLASHNTIRELLPESIKGMHIVDFSSNELDSLNAKIGLLGGSEGLKHLDVRGNRFKVPKYSILEKGTEAILAWLRNRIPAGEMDSSDGEEFIS
ncbi:Leucine-rich repeat-containing protein 40 [Erysiphe neolycopersici]|uniref:Leucine-rich repeat-containing protein 40 n=1 Tax=Erysiphe neolycopersici TaxID=212602 RepID=A0A420HXM3_9PEZI|nr:Leucine-rich repeat-containing protein 40 [Erysiphe neolycopersici]